MDKLRVKIKKVLNKDVTNLLNKYKILLVSIAIVLILSCIGLIVSYAFYQVTSTTPVILTTTPEIPDLEIKIMAEDRDTNGNGVNSYSVYPYIPKAGYKYEESMSYCTNGSTINYDATNYDASIDAIGHDVCYLYFKSTASLDITLEVYAENVDSDGIGNGEYTKLETTTLPSVGYQFNSSKSYCVYASDQNTQVTDTTVTYSVSESNFTVNASKKGAICKAYMDAMDVDIALKIYAQAKKGSSTYVEVDKVPTNNFYTLGSKSACTGTSTMSIKNQRVVISATNRTNCVAYLDVGTGPILESMQNTVSGVNIKIDLTNSNLGTTPTTYYYSKDNGKTYTSSTSSSYTFTGLTPLTEFTFKAYSVDASGNESAILSTTAMIEYVYNGLFDYSNAEQTTTIEVTGYYKLEVWGAQGGAGGITNAYGGYGSYSVGYAQLEKDTVLYLNIGGAGVNGTNTSTTKAGGYNGGGAKTSPDSSYYGASGGGATHIATVSGLLSTLSSQKDAILIVAGGGGGGAGISNNYGYGGSAGGITGNQGYNYKNNTGWGSGGTQTAAGCKTAGSTLCGSFGQGASSSGHGGSGGGGFYGGGGSNSGNIGGGGGGSGYIGNSLLVNKSMYCYSCTESTDVATKTVSTTSHTANATENCAKEGNGYAIITYIGDALE